MIPTVIIGARQRRQGTGAFLAKFFDDAGGRVVAVVGSNLNRARSAAGQLREKYALSARAYGTLPQAVQEENAQLVVIACPHEFHETFLRQAAAERCHVFCEKPLFWCAACEAPGSLDQTVAATEHIVRQFTANGRVLHLNTQWPYTLEAFYKLYPHCKKSPAAIRSIEMGLSPLTTGKAMLVDSAPHFISMLQTLLGKVELKDLKLDSKGDEISLTGVSVHPAGEVRVRLELKHCKRQPRPAWYGINGMRAHRSVKLPEYRLSLTSPQQKVLVEDPMRSSVKDCIAKLQNPPANDGRLINGMKLLHEIVNL